MTVLLWILVAVVVLVALLMAAAHGFLVGRENLAQFDEPKAPAVNAGRPVSEGHQVASRGIQQQLAASGGGGLGKDQLGAARKMMDDMGLAAKIDAQIIPTKVGDVPCEWVIAPGADPARRVVYYHGGAFMLGSPKSHRVITSKFSEIAGAAVLVPDYRLRPENPRMAGIEDCRTVYRFALENGPDGASTPDTLFVAGDSAGGNLALVITAWARDLGLRIPDGVVGLAPATDSTFASPSMRNNASTDVLLKAMLEPLQKIPQWVLLWFSLFDTKIKPNDPIISPLRGDLAGLPPTLIHASECEALVDDCRRYVNKARAAGSSVELETWEGLLHVWHMFEPTVEESKEAFRHIEAFLARCNTSRVEERVAS